MELQTDLTAGSPGKLIGRFAFHVFLGCLFEQAYSLTDTVIIGRCLGTASLAAIGVTSEISYLMIGFLLGLTSGFTVLTGQFFGSGDEISMRHSVGCSASLAAIFTAVITAAGLLFMRPLLNIMNTPSEIYADALLYIRIICAGFCFQMLYNMMAGILRALGNSRTPLFFLVFSSLLNIVLDLVLVALLHTGVAGAACATVFSQAVSGILCLIYVSRKMPVLHLKADDFRLRKNIASQQLYLGMPMALQFSVTSVGVLIVQSVINTFGTAAVAAFTAAQKLESVPDCYFESYGSASASYCAQNTGASRTDRVKSGLRSALWQTLAASAVFAFFLMLFGSRAAALIITDRVSETAPLVQTYFLCSSPFYFGLASIYIFRNFLEGAGNSVLPMAGGFVELIARLVIAFTAAAAGSFFILCLGNAAAWTGAGLFLAVSFIRLLHRKQP